jgi:hypothetical protein
MVFYPPGEEAQRETLKAARDAAHAAQLAASFTGVRLDTWQAEKIAEAARSFAEDWLHIRRPLRRDQWADEGHREYVRQRMRFDLLDTVTRQGLVPVDLPAETLRYLGRWGFMLGDDPERTESIPEVPAEAVEQGAEWETVILTLTVPVRRPSVNRAAAVKAGILAGSGI